MFLNNIPKTNFTDFKRGLKAREWWEEVVGITGCVPMSVLVLRWSESGDDQLASG